MNREDHLAWCKSRARQYLDRGDAREAWASFLSDMMKHDATRGHDGLPLGAMIYLSGGMSTVDQAREFIEGFN